MIRACTGTEEQHFSALSKQKAVQKNFRGWPILVPAVHCVNWLQDSHTRIHTMHFHLHASSITIPLWIIEPEVGMQVSGSPESLKRKKSLLHAEISPNITTNSTSTPTKPSHLWHVSKSWSLMFNGKEGSYNMLWRPEKYWKVHIIFKSHNSHNNIYIWKNCCTAGMPSFWLFQARWVNKTNCFLVFLKQVPSLCFVSAEKKKRSKKSKTPY